MTVLATDSLTLTTGGPTGLTAYSANWTYLVSAMGANDIQVTTTGASSPLASVYTSPNAYWSGVAFPNDQWAQCTIPAPIGASLNLILRMGTTGGNQHLLWLLAVPSANTALLRYFTGTWAQSTGVPNSPALLANPSANIYPSPALAAGDQLRFEVQGNTVTASRAPVGSTTFTVITNAGNTTPLTGTMVAAAQGITSGAAGIGGGRNTTGFITNWSAGDFITGPSVPTSAKGAFTIRTTSQT